MSPCSVIQRSVSDSAQANTVQLGVKFPNLKFKKFRAKQLYLQNCLKLLTRSRSQFESGKLILFRNLVILPLY